MKVLHSRVYKSVSSEPFKGELFANVKINKIRKVGDVTVSEWPRDVSYQKATPEQLKEANLRTLLPTEVVFDYETIPAAIKGTALLETDDISHQVWATHSRGMHVHSWFPEMANFPLERRNRVRKILISHYGGDLALTENHKVAIGGRVHFKSGKVKTPVSQFIGKNHKLPDWSLIAHSKVRQDRKTVMLDKSAFSKEPIVQYCLDNEIPDGTGRHGILCKNLCALMVLCKLNPEERKHYAMLFADNMPGKNWRQVLSWISWFESRVKEGKLVQFNTTEVIQWLESL